MASAFDEFERFTATFHSVSREDTSTQEDTTFSAGTAIAKERPEGQHDLPSIKRFNARIAHRTLDEFVNVMGALSLPAMGFTQVRNLRGGMEAYRAAGLPTECGPCRR